MKYKIFSVAMVLVLILISGCASIQTAQQAMKFETSGRGRGRHVEAHSNCAAGNEV